MRDEPYYGKPLVNLVVTPHTVLIEEPGHGVNMLLVVPVAFLPHLDVNSPALTKMKS